MSRLHVLTSDVEGTFLSTAIAQASKPNLFDFLEHCQTTFPHALVFAAIEHQRFRKITELLDLKRSPHAWLEKVEYVYWSGSTKDLIFIRGANAHEILLVDEFVTHVHPGQESLLIKEIASSRHTTRLFLN